MTKIEKIILKDLYESVDGLYAFTFYSRYKIEPEQISAFIGKYSEQNILIYDDNDRLYLTHVGKDIILKQLFYNKSNDSKGRFSNIPLEFLKEKIEINSPYLPDIKNLSEEIFKYKEGGIETSIKEV